MAMAAKNNVSGCLVVLAIFFGLAFWQVSIVLICIAFIIWAIIYLQSQVNLADANAWLKSHRLRPCTYSSQYGMVDGLSI